MASSSIFATPWLLVSIFTTRTGWPRTNPPWPCLCSLYSVCPWTLLGNANQYDFEEWYRWTWVWVLILASTCHRWPVASSSPRPWWFSVPWDSYLVLFPSGQLHSRPRLHRVPRTSCGCGWTWRTAWPSPPPWRAPPRPPCQTLCWVWPRRRLCLGKSWSCLLVLLEVRCSWGSGSSELSRLSSRVSWTLGNPGCVGISILVKGIPLLVEWDAEVKPLVGGGGESLISLDRLARILSREEGSRMMLSSLALLCLSAWPVFFLDSIDWLIHLFKKYPISYNNFYYRNHQSLSTIILSLWCSSCQIVNCDLCRHSQTWKKWQHLGT